MRLLKNHIKPKNLNKKIQTGYSLPEICLQPQPEWLRQIRCEAWQNYNDFSLPDRISHLWRYTDPQKFLYTPDRIALKSSKSVSTYLFKKIISTLESDTYSGIVHTSSSGVGAIHLLPELVKAGVIIEPLMTAAENHPELVEQWLGTLVSGEFGKFEALNAAVWGNGVCIFVPKGVVIEKPVYVRLQSPARRNEFIRVLLIAGEGSSIPVIEEYTGGAHYPGANFTNGVVETYVENGAQLFHLMVYNMNKGAHLLVTHRSQIQGKARQFTGVAFLGGHILKGNCVTNLYGNGSESELTGFLLGDERQHFDCYTAHNHSASHTLSTMKFKAALKGHSRSVYVGRIVIENTAPFSEAYQENRNLLLSKQCRVDSIPVLEIHQDEVKCSHGSASGPPDENQLFYLKSRGISDNDAVRLLVEGFMEDAVARLPKVFQSAVRTYIAHRLQSRISGTVPPLTEKRRWNSG